MGDAAGAFGGSAAVRATDLDGPPGLASVFDMLSSSLDAVTFSIAAALPGALWPTPGPVFPLGGAGATGKGDAACALDGAAAATARVTPRLRWRLAVSLMRLTQALNPPGRVASCTPFTASRRPGPTELEGFRMLERGMQTTLRTKHRNVLTRGDDVADHQRRVDEGPLHHDEDSAAVVRRLDFHPEGAAGDGERDRPDVRHVLRRAKEDAPPVPKPPETDKEYRRPRRDPEASRNGRLRG
ncbi:hypothetical protein THAOC_18960 [Thalassiosira oceanica]|uniref:Uncharacterized protein n=1 Tax=Thalassiosira oceanica TaxID=159749 RepID=K0SQP9_THAOC|nr:hypothetical protein THAOC_18960 [Thalassiosira oceanica]|eukprot:EJK60647.1 hypothetical protein THAOC_18960 [Thalassiosira oceanica]